MSADFFGCLTAINVRLNWKMMAIQRWPVSVRTINTKEQLHALYVPRYSLTDGTPANYDSCGAQPLTVEKALANYARWPGGEQVTIYKYDAIFHASLRPIKAIFPAYKLQSTNLLLLDGVHRAVALAQAEVEFEVDLLVIEGPIEGDALPDLRHWKSS